MTARELWCFYELDGDENAFPVRSTSDAPTLKELAASFPQSGAWHWRLRIPDPVYGHVWLDVGEEHRAPAEVIAPGVYAVYAKLLDVSARAIAHRAIRGPQRAKAETRRVEEHPPLQREEEDDDDDDEEPLDEEPVEEPEETDEDELDAVPAPVVVPDPAEVQAAVQLRRQTLAKNISDNQNQAREELRRRTEAQAEENSEFEKLRVSLGPKLKAWSEEFGKKKNIRALLADMHNVMWDEANFQPISIGDLLQPPQVKKAYYKASRYCHPDRLVGLSLEQRFIGQSVFDALSQAYADFENSGK